MNKKNIETRTRPGTFRGRLVAFVSAVLLFGLAPQLRSAISVGPTGVGPLTFDSAPPVQDFATSTNNGDATIYFDVTSLDAGVATRSAASVNSPLPGSGTVNPSASILGFRHNTALRALQSRPTTGTAPNNCAATLLVGAFQNDSGANQSAVALSYDFNVYDPVAGELPGFNVYFSLSGDAGTWQPVAGLTGNETVGNHVASLNLGSWPVGGMLYILWADDNANAVTDPSYTIDNLRLQFSLDPPIITNQPVASLTVTQAQTIQLAVGASGPGLQFQWLKDGTPMDFAANPTVRQATLVVSNATTADTGVYLAVVSNPASTVSSSPSQVTVVADTQAPIFLSASGDAANLNRFELRVNEPLCTDPNPPPVGCGSDAGDAFSWQIMSSDGSKDLEIMSLQVQGTRVLFETIFPREPGVVYRIVADPSGFTPITDLYGNSVPAGSFIEVLPSTLFRQGFDGYTGTRDIELRGAAPDGAQEGSVGVTVDTDDGGGISHGLLRFEEMLGANVGQIPSGAQIVSATLTLQHNVANANGNPVHLHRMLTGWDAATATYNSLGAGIQPDGVEAAVAIDAILDSTGRTVPFMLSVDVTAAVQAWVDGQPNYGWALLPTGTDGYRWDTSESSTPPSLAVVYTVPPCSALAITVPPAGGSVSEGSLLSLSVGVSSPGCPARFQWTHDGVDILNATNAVYTVASARPADGGSYQVRVENAAPSSATSASVTVVIVADTTPPALTRAINLNETTVALTFSKELAPGSAQNTANYVFSPPVAVTSAILVNAGNATTVTLTTAPRPYPSAQTLRISGVTDNRSSLNPISPNPTEVVLTASISVETYTGNPWSYAIGSQDGISWTAPGFVPGGDWLSGLAFFGAEDSAALTNALPVQPNPIATYLAPNNNTATPDQFVTAYFRRAVTLPALPANAAFVLCHWTDDGAIFYLDGTEIGRYNMPAGPATFVTRATAGIEASLQCLLFTASPGAHTLAVEVHQAGTTTSDGLFGAEIRATTLPPPITIARDGSGNSIVTFPADSNWQLAGSATVSGGYAPVAGNPLGRYVIPTAAQTNTQFYQLQYRGNP